MEKIKVGIIGATGYAGVELLRILLRHPNAEIAALGSVSFEGKRIDEVYPNMTGFCSLECKTNEEVIAKSDIVFAAVPHGLSQDLAAQCLEKDCKFIDLGADFRMESEEDYKEWYNGEYRHQEIHAQAVYGLPELFRDDIADKNVIGNPGCYPTSIALALSPALREGLISANGIIIDSKSGVTGAGRGLTQTSHYVDVNENFNPYKVAAHRHTPEIEQTLSKQAGAKLKVTFVPHLLPVSRGIISTCYANLNNDVTEEQIRAVYEKAYANEQFVRLLPQGKTACIRNVTFSNLCDISIHIDKRTGTGIFVGAIDNMIKGAAGQAVQNMNILFDLPEATGLDFIPPAF